MCLHILIQHNSQPAFYIFLKVDIYYIIIGFPSLMISVADVYLEGQVERY